MIRLQSQSALPRFSLDRLAPVAPGLIILAFLGNAGDRAVARAELGEALRPLLPAEGAADDALAGLSGEGAVSVSRGGRCRIAAMGEARAHAALGPVLTRPWDDVVARGLAPLALHLRPADAATRRYLARRDNLEGVALACLYGLRTTSALPSRAEVRFLFLRALLSARLPECEAAFTEITMRNTLRDPVSRALMLGAAGLNRGTLRDAEGALLRQALELGPDAIDTGAEGDDGAAVPRALVRHAAMKIAPRAGARVELPKLTLVQHKLPALEKARPSATVSLGAGKPDADKAALSSFAATVRELARTLTTHPFAGRVAIAQVYDVGQQRGLEFGPLESFKQRIAEAGRAGLLDLERYDIAGPMDASLRDRSRTAFGRDVRHFIVNEWI